MAVLAVRAEGFPHPAHLPPPSPQVPPSLGRGSQLEQLVMHCTLTSFLTSMTSAWLASLPHLFVIEHDYVLATRWNGRVLEGWTGADWCPFVFSLCFVYLSLMLLFITFIFVVFFCRSCFSCIACVTSSQGGHDWFFFFLLLSSFFFSPNIFVHEKEEKCLMMTILWINKLVTGVKHCY